MLNRLIVMHNRGVFHFDIKAENVMFQDDAQRLHFLKHYGIARNEYHTAPEGFTQVSYKRDQLPKLTKNSGTFCTEDKQFPALLAFDFGLSKTKEQVEEELKSGMRNSRRRWRGVCYKLIAL